MRLLWLVALWALVAADPLTDYQQIKQTLRSWNSYDNSYGLEHNTVNRVVEEFDDDVYSSHTRSKRAVYDVVSSGQNTPDKSCQLPGYTGEFCEFPICDNQNPNPQDQPAIDGEGATIDTAYIANCSSQHVILIDDTMFDIRIELEADAAINPMLSLVDAYGDVQIAIPLNVDERPDQYNIFFSKLNPGRYLVHTFADVKTHQCHLTVRAHTYLNIGGGFVNAEGRQPERSDFPSQGMTYKDLLSVGAFHVNGVKFPATLKTISFTSGFNASPRAFQLKTRYNCSYEYYYESFLCRNIGDYLYTIEGVTYQGFSFRRVYPLTCVSAPPTDAPVTTTPAPAGNCSGNGFLINNLNGTQSCFCSDRWTGSDCSQIVCLNGGSVSGNKCFCKSEYGGEHCEHVICDNFAGYEFNAEEPTLTLVVRARLQTASVVNDVINATETMVNSLQFDSGYLKSFIIVFFNNKDLILAQRYTNFNEAKADMIKYANAGDATGDCTDNVFQSVISALQRNPNNKSPIYVITDATPSDLEYADEAFYQSALWRAPLHIFFVKPAPVCSISTDSGAYRKMGEIAARTTGEVFYTNQLDFYKLFMAHMKTTLYKSQLMYSTDLPTCDSQLPYQTVAVDSSTESLTIIAIGSNLTISVKTPEGYDLKTYEVAYSDSITTIWTINGLHTGNWMFSFLSPDNTSACAFKIYQKAFNSLTLTPQFDIFYAFTEAISVDGIALEPLVGADMSIVVHLVNYPNLPQELVRSDLTVYSIREGRQHQIYASNGVWRDGCSYNFYFPEFRCNQPNEIMYFNFYAGDSRGMAIQRSGVFTCTLIQPTIKPPGDCLNGGVMNPANNSCFCPLGLSGTHCETIVCFNGGTLIGSKCKCPSGWTGTSCDIAACPTRGFSPEFELQGVDMIFGIELTQNGHAQIAFLDKYLPYLIRDIHAQNPNWIGRFVVVGFNSTWGDLMAVSPAWDTSAIAKAIHSAAITQYTDVGCNVQLYRALDSASMKHATVPGSYIQLFLVSNPDYSDMGGWNIMYDNLRAFNLHLTVFMGISSRNPNLLYCNATMESLWPLEALAFSGIGSMYPTQQATIPELIKLIPLQYSQSLVYSKQSMDCSAGMMAYFPVDSYAQTIQLDVYGQDPTVTVYNPKGEVISAEKIVYDSVSMTSVYEVRKPCDDGWVKFGQYCYFFGTEKLSWPAAKAFCHSAGGQLTDDLTDDSHAFLTQQFNIYSGWTGGFNNGSWLWDRPDGTEPIPIQDVHYVYWADGTVPDGSGGLQCLQWDATRRAKGDTWTAAHCSDQQFFLCEKHGYDQNYKPHTLGDDDLLPGKYFVRIQPKIDASNPNNICSVAVFVQSSLQMITGFTTNLVQDWPNNDPIKDSPSNRVMAYIRSEDNENRIPVLSAAYIMDAYNNTFYDAAKYQYRLNCEWPWITQTFSCPPGFDDNNELAFLHSGEDEFGYAFQRYSVGHCTKATLTCGNGGVRWNGTCVCDEYWQGTFCTVPICVNNGTLSTDAKSCMCPTGYAGPNCQFEVCEKRNPQSFYTNGKSMILIIEATKQNSAAAQDFANNLEAAVNKSPATWFNNFFVVTFDSQNVWVDEVSKASDAALKIMARVINPSDPGSCSMPLWNALNTFMNDESFAYVQYPRSELFVITSAGASDALNMQKHDMHVIADWQLILNYIYVSSTTCGDTPKDGSLNAIVRFAYTTDGNAVFVTSSTIGNFFVNYLPTRFAMSTLRTPTYGSFSCGSSAPYLIPVDHDTTAIYVSVSSEIGTLGVKNPNGKIVSADVLYNVGRNKLYRINIDQVQGGIWGIGLTSTGACYINIYAQGGANVYPQFALPTSDNPSGSRQDGIKHSPIAFVNNVVTAHLETSNPAAARLTYVKIYDVDQGTEIFNSELYGRFGCSYEYVSDVFTCNADLLIVYIHGFDALHQPFRRQYIAYCINNSTHIPTGSPPTTNTAPVTISTVTQTIPTSTTPVPTSSYGYSDVPVDVVFIVDESASSAQTHDTLHSFIQTLMIPFSVGTKARVGLITCTGQSNMQAPVATLGSISSQSMLSSYLTDLSEYGIYGVTGQYLQQSLDIATNAQFKSSGYRTEIRNHVIIYVTSTSTFSDNPDTSKIIGGDYGVITVGFGNNLDVTALTKLAGGSGCAFTTSDNNILSTNIKATIQQLIFNADANGGVYCK